MTDRIAVAITWSNRPPRQALSISQFCVRNNISRSFFYKLKKHGKGPRIMEVDGRRIISPEAERDWRVEREHDGLEATHQVPFARTADQSRELKNNLKKKPRKYQTEAPEGICE